MKRGAVSLSTGSVIARVVGVILLLQFGCSRTSESPRDVFELFESALAKGEMHELDALVSGNTVRYFRGLQPWIVRGDESSLKKLTSFDRYMVLSLRMHLDSLTPEDWKRWSEVLDSETQSDALSGYLEAALEEVLFKTTLGKVDSINGTTAGQLLRMGSSTGLSLHFTNEKGWKIELARLFRAHFDQKMKPYLSDQYRNQDRVWKMLNSEYGERVNRSLYRSRIAKDPGD